MTPYRAYNRAPVSNKLYKMFINLIYLLWYRVMANKVTKQYTDQNGWENYSRLMYNLWTFMSQYLFRMKILWH